MWLKGLKFFAVGIDFGRRSNDLATRIPCSAITDMFVFMSLQLTSVIDKA